MRGPGSRDPPEGERARGARLCSLWLRPVHCVCSPGGDAVGVKIDPFIGSLQVLVK